MKNNLRIILAKQKKTIADLHDLTGISKTTLTNLYYERTKNPTLSTINVICTALNISLGDLFTLKEVEKDEAAEKCD